jgi:hypothetical protein
MVPAPLNSLLALVVAPEDTSDFKRPGIVMIEVALWKQLRATARGEF